MVDDPTAAFLVLVLFALLSYSTLSIHLVDAFVLYCGYYEFRSIVDFSFFLQSTRIYVRDLYILGIGLNVRFALP